MIAKSDVERTVCSCIEFLKQRMTFPQCGESCLTAGVGAVCPLGEIFVKIECGGVVGMRLEICGALRDILFADGDCRACIHIIVLIGVEMVAVIPTVAPGGFLHTHSKIRHGGNSCFQIIARPQFIDFLGCGKNGDRKHYAQESGQKKTFIFPRQTFQDNHQHRCDDHDQ